MTPEQIEQWARKARMTLQRDPDAPHWHWHAHTQDIARFAALVRDAALEEAAKVCDERAKRYDERATASDAMDDYERRAECAEAARFLAAAIRALKGE